MERHIFLNDSKLFDLCALSKKFPSEYDLITWFAEKFTQVREYLSLQQVVR
jgi:hypothetical protein